jgi:hypothetical protein
MAEPRVGIEVNAGTGRRVLCWRIVLYELDERTYWMQACTLVLQDVCQHPHSNGPLDEVAPLPTLLSRHLLRPYRRCQHVI